MNTWHNTGKQERSHNAKPQCERTADTGQMGLGARVTPHPSLSLLLVKCYSWVSKSGKGNSEIYSQTAIEEFARKDTQQAKVTPPHLCKRRWEGDSHQIHIPTPGARAYLLEETRLPRTNRANRVEEQNSVVHVIFFKSPNGTERGNKLCSQAS